MVSNMDIMLRWILFMTPSIGIVCYIWISDRLSIRTDFSKSSLMLLLGVLIGGTIVTSYLPEVAIELLYRNHKLDTHKVKVLDETVSPLEHGRYFRWETDKQDTRLYYAVDLGNKGYTIKSTSANNSISISYTTNQFRVEKFNEVLDNKYIYQFLGLQDKVLEVSYIFYVPKSSK